MPLLDDIRDNALFAREFREGSEQGEKKEAIHLFKLLADKRFGTIPTALEQRLSGLTAPELEDLSLRVLDARTVDELLN